MDMQGPLASFIIRGWSAALMELADNEGHTIDRISLARAVKDYCGSVPDITQEQINEVGTWIAQQISFSLPTG